MEITNLLGFPIDMVETDKRTKIIRIQDYDLSFVANRLRRKKILSEHKIDSAIIEFKRFITMIVLGHAKMSVPCREVDEVWHAFILYTKEYEQFCTEINGTFIHHCPHDSKFATSYIESDRNTELAYQQYFGKPVLTFTSNLRGCSSGGDGGGDGGICQCDNACSPLQ